MSPSEIEKISSVQVQEYIQSNQNADVQKLLLKTKEILGVPAKSIAEQLIGRKKILVKSPQFYQKMGVVYPPALNLEQSSSETTARFKTKVLSAIFAQKKIADLTGGFGIDSFFFSDVADHVDFIEPNEELLTIVSHNFKVFEKLNVTFHLSTAEKYLHGTNKTFDLVYLDPSRRSEQNKKVFRFQDCTPNILQIQNNLFEKASLLLMKASPLIDISQGLKEISFVKRIIVISVDNECREVLFLAERDFVNDPIIETYNLTKTGEQKFIFQFASEASAVSEYSGPLLYLYEPNSSILKSGCFKLVGEKFDLKKIHVNTHLYTSAELKKDFPGRIFKIESDKWSVKNDLPDGKANVVTRNFPQRADELQKKLGLKDGGDKFVIGFSGLSRKYVVLATKVE